MSKIGGNTMPTMRADRYLPSLRHSAQVVLAKAWNKAEIDTVVNDKITDFANRGFRALGLAIAQVRCVCGDGGGVCVCVCVSWGAALT
jgi:H+-transporting ATPase